ncbi:hypothetical protein CHS0354_015423 [Potamilus streckersoni]|uniref:Protein PET100 homolog, mitochondrial n=1 Tax=Potamilus streckersoni TaxID=2493646 RepID=A0AAE0S0X1_9BIVA|nr:hypothetical protein CHS0354_015423 [Potamilus streckersoni]
MGTWHLEVVKMAMYMTFPVGLFYIFNRPEYFEEHVNKKRKEIMPPPNIEAIDLYKAAVERARRKEEKWEEELAKVTNNKK